MKPVKIFSSKESAFEALPLNTPRKIIIADHVLCIVRTAGGIYSIQDDCPHQKTSLSQGSVNTYNEIICPLHEYRFSLKHGQESNLRTQPADTYLVEVKEDGVYLYF